MLLTATRFLNLPTIALRLAPTERFSLTRHAADGRIENPSSVPSCARYRPTQPSSYFTTDPKLPVSARPTLKSGDTLCE